MALLLPPPPPPSFSLLWASADVGVVDFAEALDEFDDVDDSLSLEVFGDADGGDFLVCCDPMLAFDSQRSIPFKCGDVITLTAATDAALSLLATLKSSGASLSLKLDSYGLKLDLNSFGELPFVLPPGDDEILSLILLLFSIFASSLGFGVASEPIALHVCANNANGLDFVSNCE